MSDTARAVLAVIDNNCVNEIFNISGNVELPNREVIKKILKIYYNISHDHDWQSYTMDSKRQGQDVRYAIDDTKLKQLGWQPRADFDTELDAIVDYYRKNFVW